MAEKLDLLIKEFNDFFDKEITNLEVTYKKFGEDYKKAILNTQPFDVFKANGDETKDWPKDVFPDKPEIKTYGDFYKWIFNPEYGSVYYDKGTLSTEKRLDAITGEEEKNPKLTPISGGGYIYNLPRKLYVKLTNTADPGETPSPDVDIVQSALYETLNDNYTDVERYKMIVFLKNTITGAVFSKKIVDKILSMVRNEYISANWDKKTANDHWYEGFQNAVSHGMDVGIIDIVGREYPFSQDYYGGTSYLFIENPWARTSAIYDALIEAIKENPAPVAPEKPIETNSVKDNTSTKSPDPFGVTGKFSLKLKSGPGVIIGVTDVDIVDGKADFSGIEFDQAGDYVITVGCTSPDVDPMEIKIKVLPPPEVIPQESKGATESNASGTRPIIAQIDRPTLVLKPMSFPRQGTDDASSKQVATSIGLTPFLNYYGSQINDRDIQSFILEHEGMIPKVTILFRDSNGMISKEPPRDDTTFEIFLQSRSANLKSIHLKFKIEEFKKLPSNQYSLSGTLDISGLYRNKFTVKRGTSFEVLREVCKDLGLGFNSNIDNTKDNMPWRNIGDKQYKFMEEIIKHSYTSEESFMAGYIDYYYCFNYVDIEKEMKRDISKDVGIDTGGVANPSDKDSDKIGKLILSSEKGLQSSNNYFVKVGERNESTKISMEQGYRTRTKFYDKVKKMFLVFDVDSTTTDGAKSHILKGGGDDKEAFDNNYVTKYQGKIDTDNTHVNYNYAVTQNRINLDNMMKNQLDIVLPNPNFNLYRFQKIQAFLVNEAASVGSPEIIQWRYSGEWMIASIKYNFKNGSLKQEITLVRKELGKDPAEIKAGTNNGTKEKKEEKNENPIVGTASSTITNKPNEKYKIGDIFTVQNSDGTKYVLTVTKLSENGTDIVATLKDPNVVPNTALTNPDTIVGVTQSTVVEPVVTPIVASASGIYTGKVTLETYKYGSDTGDFNQSQVTDITKNHPWIKNNGSWVGSNFVSNGTGIKVSEDENLKDMKNIYIAIKRPLPTYKPDDNQKNQTPYNWTLFEFSDTGIDENDMSGKNAGESDPRIYVGLLYRMFYAMEAWGHTKGGGIEWGGFDDGGNVPHGSIKIYDEAKNVVIESSYKGTDQLNPGGVSIKSTTDARTYLMKGGFTGTPPKYEYDRWFTFPGDGTPDATVLVEPDQEYTQVGDKNTIYYDMSDPDKYKPGVYTIEIKYYVPIYEKVNADGENQGKTYNGAGGWYTKTQRLTKAETTKPYEEKTLTATFTIVKKSKKK